MALPVKHTITLAENHQMPFDATTYKNMGTSPRFHVYCTCQWEGWAHSLFQAHRFLHSHEAAQAARGNAVELIIPDNLKDLYVVAEQPSKVDVPREDTGKIEPMVVVKE